MIWAPSQGTAMPICLRTQKAKVFEQTVIPAEPVKEHNDIYKLLGIKPPKELPIKMRSNV